MSADDGFGVHYDTDDDYLDAEVEDDDTAGLLAEEVDSLRPAELPFQVLKEDEIRRRMEDEIGQLSALLCLSNSEASILLRHSNWDAYKLQDSWFTNESELRHRVGLSAMDNPTAAAAADQSDCRICFDSFSPDSFNSAACGHQFCRDCWRQYFATSVNGGPGTLNLRCPEPSCTIAVTEDLINKIADEIDRKRYQKYLLRSYVEENRKLKWCPAAGCEHAVQFAAAAGDPNYDVSCLCSHAFCWNCCEEPHRPVNCITVKNWIAKNDLESANENWKKAYTKPCPNCSKPIEKNAGCMRMKCAAPCNYQFCWLCLQNWDVHGYGGCNQYQPPEDSTLPQLRAEL
ncbi:unnamed protein product [Linum tenue]|uniref:RBR-type E3 ubiquitin transferase n=2 Tax=Linum tenue TaxID=586396 RepID=A0AAV0KT21_9ROSI|nr:unnamed protein product [Linum tenue]